MGGKIRAFVAIPMPEAVIEALDALQKRLRGRKLPVRWVPPANIHLTMKFLGNVGAEQLPLLTDAMATAVGGRGAFVLRAAGLGVFPHLRRPNVLWVGLSGETGSLGALQRDLEQLLDEAGFPREVRPFRGHLTLGRFKGRPNTETVADALDRWAGWTTDSFTADRLHLIESRLHPQGAEYLRLAETVFDAP